ncbi:hypothetical protein BDY19DRAFT_906835 [Irpex rosettiformis]|uniref:Uncharacterized protein n=1 Tax=Irpex rosettiformis TaxID=378272 RepID=A0ACB8U2N6_9APHY|nr:hypothetical protein BDY19DRAFT_906835 [Irpex rosettiformis]
MMLDWYDCRPALRTDYDTTALDESKIAFCAQAVHSTVIMFECSHGKPVQYSNIPTSSSLAAPYYNTLCSKLLPNRQTCHYPQGTRMLRAFKPSGEKHYMIFQTTQPGDVAAVPLSTYKSVKALTVTVRVGDLKIEGLGEYRAWRRVGHLDFNTLILYSVIGRDSGPRPKTSLTYALPTHPSVFNKLDVPISYSRKRIAADWININT